MLELETEISKKWFEMQGIGREKIIYQMFTTHNSLFHYTTMSGLLGIVENNCFWLTNLKYMNDLSEQKFAYEIVNNTINKLKCDKCYSSKFINIINRSSSINTYRADRYAACFTSDGDSLPMWCMYGKESGVSIEFDLTSNFHFTIGPNCFFEDIIYDCNILVEFVKIVVDLYHAAYNEFIYDSSSTFNSTLENILSMELSSKVVSHVDNFKNKRFSHESETRLLYSWKNDAKIKHRVKNNLIVPYVEMPTKDLNNGKLLPITSIIIGPGEEQELVKQSVEDFIRAKGYDVEIKKSEIPYRSR